MAVESPEDSESPEFPNPTESPESSKPPESPESPEVRKSPEVRVPDGETAARCPYCARPFRTDRLRALHLGDVHGEDCTADQREAYEEAKEAEREDLFVFHLKVVAGLVAVYAVLLLSYMAVSAMQAPG